jgi:cobalt-zinc-cadmium efflux system outer membrane protein
MRVHATIATALAALVFAQGALADEAKVTAAAPNRHLKLRWGPFGSDTSVKRTQIEVPSSPAMPDASLPLPSIGPQPVSSTGGFSSGRPISLELALYGAITNNPDLVALRNSNIASPEAVEVARRFPTTLNPTLWMDYRPITLIPRDTFANSGSNGGSSSKSSGPFYHNGQGFFYISLRQPIELGHQTTHRWEIAKAALSQQQWTVLQAELLAMVQTYRFFETAAYRREKLKVANRLADFNDRLVQTMKRRAEANQVQQADVVLAQVENEATRQLVDVARQDYANSLMDLQNQIGQPENAGTAEPFGEFTLPEVIPELEEEQLIAMAVRCRPEIQAARSAAAGALAAVNLAKGDRIPTPIVGPEYQTDEAGIQYIGFVYITPIPWLNGGKPLVRQREADLRRALTTVQQLEKRTVIQVRSAAAKWNAAGRLVKQTAGLSNSLRKQVEQMENLFELNQTDLTKLFQVRQRLIQLENAELDAVWAATQAQADLLTALGIPGLIQSLPRANPAARPSVTVAPPPPVSANPAAAPTANSSVRR